MNNEAPIKAAVGKPSQTSHNAIESRGMQTTFFTTTWIEEATRWKKSLRDFLSFCWKDRAFKKRFSGRVEQPKLLYYLARTAHKNDPPPKTTQSMSSCTKMTSRQREKRYWRVATVTLTGSVTRWTGRKNVSLKTNRKHTEIRYYCNRRNF